jgi:hypothetical protein
VAYEEVIKNAETEARRLLDFCGLAWDDAVLGFQDSQRPVRTASVHQVRQGIYSSSVDKWERYAKYLGPVTDVLGERADIASGNAASQS